jgi:hypothetical protein
MAERQAGGDPINVALVNQTGSTEPAAALGAFGGQEVAFPRVGAEDFAGSSDFKPFGNRFFGSDTFRASHSKILSSKKSANYRRSAGGNQVVIDLNPTFPLNQGLPELRETQFSLPFRRVIRNHVIQQASVRKSKEAIHAE